MNLNPDQIIFKGLAGSRLYGTDHATSDYDYKIVYAHDLEGLITQASDTDRKKDDDSNSEYEYFSLRKFSTLLNQNQTVAIELLFIPLEKQLIKTAAWSQLLLMRDEVVSKDLMPFIGYARNQARVYSAKGDRLGFLRTFYNWLKVNYTGNETCDGVTRHIHELTLHGKADWAADAMTRDYLSFEIKKTPNDRDVKQVNLLGKGFEEFASPKTWLDRIEVQIKKYGERAKLAEDSSGHDLKATYHAVRVIEEAIELLLTGNLTFPRPEVALLLDIRAGKYDYNTTCAMIQNRVEFLEALIPRSTLRETPDREAINKWFYTWQRVAIYREIGD